jgi:hypothetical protein
VSRFQNKPAAEARETTRITMSKADIQAAINLWIEERGDVPGGDYEVALTYRIGTDEQGRAVDIVGIDIDMKLTAPAPSAPAFPQHICPRGAEGACGFVEAGVGYQCKEGDACQKYVHPGDPGFAELRAHDKAMAAMEPPATPSQAPESPAASGEGAA